MPGQGKELFHNAHYNVIAKRIRETRAAFKLPAIPEPASTIYQNNLGARMALDILVVQLANWFAEDNPRFEKDQWYEVTETFQDDPAKLHD